MQWEMHALVFKILLVRKRRGNRKESECKIMGSRVTRDNDKRELVRMKWERLFWHKVHAAASDKVSM